MQNMPPIFLVADDHFGFRDGMALMLSKTFEACIVHEAANGIEMLAAAANTQYDLIFADIAMPQMNGFEATKKIIQKDNAVKIMGLSMHHDLENMVLMLHCGARGFLCKSDDKEKMYAAIQTLLEGNYYAGGQVMSATAFLKFMKQHEHIYASMLTHKEQEILKLITGAFSSKMIGAQLGLSLKTVEAHRHNIFQKTKTHNLADLIIFATKRHWV